MPISSKRRLENELASAMEEVALASGSEGREAEKDWIPQQALNISNTLVKALWLISV